MTHSVKETRPQKMEEVVKDEGVGQNLKHGEGE